MILQGERERLHRHFHLQPQQTNESHQNPTATRVLNQHLKKGHLPLLPGAVAGAPVFLEVIEFNDFEAVEREDCFTPLSNAAICNGEGKLTLPRHFLLQPQQTNESHHQNPSAKRILNQHLKKGRHPLLPGGGRSSCCFSQSH
ncbi:hypothetical protein CDAR_605831 [Caerostris darwini]|uniref:Uncharacterized protein n=1 Tax=Caerostris darwini TaxID=1538125 RepID=A0AAV4RAX0_9ARAC|nr:hypothetical protein CDAR_605831 [Caerostris darwini]